MTSILDAPRAFAHRGLWSPHGPPENSIGAFQAAVSAGFGIEMDVQLSCDGHPIVFHDPFLDRMTVSSGPVWQRTLADLKGLALNGSDETIPCLEAALHAIPSGTPLLVELKRTAASPEMFAAAVLEVLSKRGPEVAVMAFDAEVNAALAKLAGDRTHGILSIPRESSGASAFTARLAEAATLGAGFAAVWHSDVEIAKATTPNLPAFAWTVDSADALSAAAPLAQGLIFEPLSPNLVREAMAA